MNVPQLRLKDVLLLHDSGVWAKEDSTAGINVIRSTNFNSNGTLDLSKLALRAIPDKKRKEKLLSAGDILLEKSGGGPKQPVGRVAYFEGGANPQVFGNFIARLRANPKCCDSEYLFYCLLWWHLSGVTVSYQKQTTGIRNLEVKRYLELNIPVPPLSEQCRIADILKRADGIRRLRKQAQNTTHQLIPALFIEMFGDPAKNPKGWNVVTFSDVGTLDRGKSKHRPRNDPILIGGPYPFIQTGDVANSDGVIRDFTATYSEVGLQQSRLWLAGTLCITIAANIADTATLGFDACFPDSVVGFIPNRLVTTEFVQYWLSFLKPVLEASAPQLAQKNINLRILRSLPIIVPPIELQNEFVSRLTSIQSITVQQESAQDSAESNFQSILYRAFSGKI